MQKKKRPGVNESTPKVRPTGRYGDNTQGGTNKVRHTGNFGDNAIKGASGNPVRYTGNYGDNAMGEPQLLDEATEGTLDRLEAMLRKAGISDDEIKTGLTLTPVGYQKVAARLGVSADEVRTLLASLATRLRQRSDVLAEAGDRYAYESDFMGSVTIRDTQAGTETFLRGNEAARMLKMLKSGRYPEQKVLAHFASHHELHEAKVGDLTGRSDRAMSASDEDQSREREHWKAHEETGFYGAQGAGVIALAKDTGRILVALRSRQVEEPGTWGNFGGAIDSGESPREAAIGEFYEETGYRGEIVDVKPLYVFKKGTFRYSNFLVVVPTEFDPKLNWEADDAAWVEFGDWPQPLHFGLRALFSDAESVRTIMSVINGGGGSLTEADGDADDFSAEIDNPIGSYNFPWSHDGELGFGTVKFNRETGAIKVVSVRDSNGDVIERPNPSMMKALEKQAIAFIGEA